MNLDVKDGRTQLGLALIVLGALALLANTGWLAGVGRLVGVIVFAAAGAVVLSASRDTPGRLWTLPVGFGLVGLGLANLPGPWWAGAPFVAVGLGFLAIHLRDPARERWWALLPAGLTIALGVAAGVDEVRGVPDEVGGVALFGGAAVTFFALTRLRHRPQRWAIWPAAALALVAVMVLASGGGWWLPAALIAVGAALFVAPSLRSR